MAAQANKSHALVPGTRGKAVPKTVHASPGPHSTATATCAVAFAASPPSSASCGGESPEIASVQIPGIRWCYRNRGPQPWSPKQNRPGDRIEATRPFARAAISRSPEAAGEPLVVFEMETARMRIGSSSDLHGHWHGDRNGRGLRAFTGRQPLAGNLRGTCAVGGTRYGRTT